MPTNVYPESGLELLERIERLERLFTNAEGTSASWYVTGEEASGGVEVSFEVKQEGTYLFVQGATGYTEHAPGGFALFTLLDGVGMTTKNVNYQNVFFHDSNGVHHRYSDNVALIHLVSGVTHKLKWENSVNNICDINDRVIGFVTLAQGFPGPEGKEGKEGPEGEVKNPVYINVKKYGAKGDGSTDDTIAIEAAIEAAGEHGTIFFPQGEYVISKALSIHYEHFAIIGSGYRSSTLLLKALSNSSMITTPDDKVQRYGLVIKDLAFSGNSENQTGESPVILIRGMNECRLENLYIFSPRGAAIFIGQATEGIFNTVPKITNNIIRGTANSQKGGIELEPGSSDAQVIGNDIGEFKIGSGIFCGGHNGFELIGNQCWKNRFGYFLFGASRGRIIGCLADNSQRYGFVAQNVVDTQFVACQSRESGQEKEKEFDGFFIEGTTEPNKCFDIIFSGCKSQGTKTRFGLNLNQYVDVVRIAACDWFNNPEGGRREGATQVENVEEATSTIKEIVESEAIGTSLEGWPFPGKAQGHELSWWRTKSTEFWASLITWWNKKEEQFVSRWWITGEVNGEPASKGLAGVGITIANNLKTKVGEIRVVTRGQALLILNSSRESAWLKVFPPKKSFVNYGTSVVTFSAKGFTQTAIIATGIPEVKSLITTANSTTGQYTVNNVAFEVSEEPEDAEIIVRSTTGEVAAGTKVTINWMAFGTG